MSKIIAVPLENMENITQEYLVVVEDDLAEAEGQIYTFEEPNGDKSVEINIDIIKNVFSNFLSLYEALITKNCHSCNAIQSEEFIRVHNNFVDIDGLFKIFDLSFDKTVMENFVKRSPTISKEKSEHSCLISACTKKYSSFESVQVHFLKSHCSPIPCFDSNLVEEKIDFSTIQQDSDGRYICQFDDYCQYTTKDRSNFRVHRERHRMAKRFRCFVCNKYFAAKEPLMIHFIRFHFAPVPWGLANTDIRFLRKAIRKCTSPELFDLDLDHIPDIEEDLSGPESLQNLEISRYVSQAINDRTVTRGNTCTTSVESTKETTTMDELGSKIESPRERKRMRIVIQEFGNGDLVINEVQDSKVEDQIDAAGEENEQNKEEKQDKEEEQDKEEKGEKELEPKIKKLKTRAKNFRCIHDYCSQDFYGKKQLLVHLKSNHDEENEFVCEFDGCFSRFKTQTVLSQHERRHKCQLQCEYCQYRTHLNAQMEKHVRQHTGEPQPHICPECNQRFAFLGQMANHRKKQHQIVESLACDSPGCGRLFKTMLGLKKHQRELHMNIGKTKASKRKMTPP